MYGMAAICVIYVWHGYYMCDLCMARATTCVICTGSDDASEVLPGAAASQAKQHVIPGTTEAGFIQEASFSQHLLDNHSLLCSTC